FPDIAVLPDGKILLGSDLYRTPHWLWAAARFTPSGALDGSFGAGGIATATLPDDLDAGEAAMAVRPDGSFLLAGYAFEGAQVFYTPYRGVVTQFRADGSVDASFAAAGTFITPDVNEWFHDVDVLPDGRSVLTSRYSSTRGQS